MANRPAPLFAGEKTAAALFDMAPGEFRQLVEGGHLPPPREIGGFMRWDVEELRRIASGEAMDGGGMAW